MELSEQEILESLFYTARDGLEGVSRAKTTREIAEEAGMSVPMVRRHLAELVKAGKVAHTRKPFQRPLDGVWTTVQAYYPVSEEAD